MVQKLLISWFCSIDLHVLMGEAYCRDTMTINPETQTKPGLECVMSVTLFIYVMSGIGALTASSSRTEILKFTS